MWQGATPFLLDSGDWATPAHGFAHGVCVFSQVYDNPDAEGLPEAIRFAYPETSLTAGDWQTPEDPLIFWKVRKGRRTPLCAWDIRYKP